MSTDGGDKHGKAQNVKRGTAEELEGGSYAQLHEAPLVLNEFRPRWNVVDEAGSARDGLVAGGEELAELVVFSLFGGKRSVTAGD